MNAADIFVLPTVAEGCCNAIVEAMACGLPVVSSDLPFNDDILNETNSIRIDPTNINQIAEAIKILKESIEMRQRLSAGALKTAEHLSVHNRAVRILAFINERANMGL